MVKADVDGWVEDWKRDFACDYPEKTIESWCGKDIKITRAEEEFNFSVIGWGKLLVTSEEGHAMQFSIITDEGKQIALRSGDVVEVVEEES